MVATEAAANPHEVRLRRKSSCSKGHDLTAPGGRIKSGDCAICNRERARAWYSRTKSVRRAKINAYYGANRSRMRSYQRDYYNRNSVTLKSKQYNIPPEKLEAMLAAGCVICSGYHRLAIDHNHACCAGNSSCGRCVRGVLCSHCNTASGLLRDSPILIARLIDYLNGDFHVV